ncbi:MAG: sugar phosphorylase [Campylobacteraceae bacterium 4484_4]|nr:MAG: sugar phosphorylase [Campylobacteraceae bacterium 4484_4]
MARLRMLYSEEDAKSAYEGIERLIAGYRKKITSRDYYLNQNDVILITYGDQVVRPGEEPLKTLKRFLDDHIKEVINTVHILPFYPYSSDDGFSVIDYKDVSPRMGSWEDIEALREHYWLMFDGVINHVSQYSFWFKSFLNNDPAYKDFFIEVDPVTDLSKVVRPRTSPLLHEFKDSEGKVRYIWTTFSKDQVDLNYHNYRVLLAVLDALLFYIEKGASLIRLDAIAFVWKEIGTPCIHLPQTHELIQLMREVLHQVAPEVIIITETNVPHKENISYFGNGGDEAQMVYNFALPPLIAHSIRVGDATVMREWAKGLRLPSDKVCFFNFTASHDGVGLRPVSELLNKEEIDALVEMVERRGGYVSYRATEEGSQSPYELNASYIDIVSDPAEPNVERVRKMMLSQAVALAMPGVPGIYFHSLVGSTSDIEGVKRTGILRSINREKLNYDLLIEEMQKSGSLRTMIYRSYKQLLSIRKRESSFHPYADFEIIDSAPEFFVIRKYNDEKEELLAVHNFSNRPILFLLPPFVQLPAMELIKNEPIEDEAILCDPYQVLWIKYKKG